MELSKHNNFEVLDAMLAISEITGLEFEHVCKTNLATWWGTLFDQMIENEECPKPLNIFDRENTKYKGALVLDPKQGMYHNMIVVDAASLSILLWQFCIIFHMIVSIASVAKESTCKGKFKQSIFRQL
jgi:DNA polymerase elongation subunit (family B)